MARQAAAHIPWPESGLPDVATCCHSGAFSQLGASKIIDWCLGYFSGDIYKIPAEFMALFISYTYLNNFPLQELNFMKLTYL